MNLNYTAAKLMRNYLQYTHMWSFQFGYWFQFAETYSFLVGSWNLALSYINILHQMHPLKDHVILHDDGRGKLKTLIWSRKFSFTKIKSPLWRLQSTIHPGQQWGIFKPVQHVNTSRAILIHIFLSLVPLVRAGCTTTLHSFVSICNFEGLHKSSGDKAEMYWESSLWPLLASGSQLQFWNLNLRPIYLSIILT